MTIFIDALSARNGGGVTYIENLISSLPKKNNLKIYIASQNFFVLKKKDNRIKFIKINWPVYNPILRAIWQIFYLPIIIKNLKIKVLFVPGGINLCKVSSNCKLVTMFRNMLPFDKLQISHYPFSLFKLKIFLQKFLILYTLKNADFIIFISKFSKSFINENFFSIEKKCEVIPHGVDKKFFIDSQDTVFSLIPKGKYFLYVSRIEFYKRQMEVLEAFILLNKKMKNYKLYFVGPSNNDYSKKLMEKIKSENLEKKVFILGDIKQDRLPQLYKNAEINIFCSETENCPNILLEAMSAGKPVVCSNLEPMIEFGNNAPLYCVSNNPYDIAKKIKFILNNKNIYRDLSIKSINQSKKFSKSFFSRKTWSVLLNQLEI